MKSCSRRYESKISVQLVFEYWFRTFIFGGRRGRASGRRREIGSQPRAEETNWPMACWREARGERILKATVWSENCGNEGYYGLALKENYYTMTQAVIQGQSNPVISVQISTTGKKVEKRLVNSNQVLKTWDTIAKAAAAEGFSAAKMSRSVKDKTVFKDYYYCVAQSV